MKTTLYTIATVATLTTSNIFCMNEQPGTPPHTPSRISRTPGTPGRPVYRAVPQTPRTRRIVRRNMTNVVILPRQIDFSEEVENRKKTTPEPSVLDNKEFDLENFRKADRGWDKFDDLGINSDNDEWLYGSDSDDDFRQQ